MTSIPNNPQHPLNQYPWNRRPKLRKELGDFLRHAELENERHGSPISQATTRRVLAWLRELMDKTPQDLNP